MSRPGAAVGNLAPVLLCVGAMGGFLLLVGQARAESSVVAQVTATPKTTPTTPRPTPLETQSAVTPIAATKATIIVVTAPGITPSPTPTSQPGAPQLVQPDNEAVLPQPVPPGEWFFKWNAKTGPCYCELHVRGPGGRYIHATREPIAPPYYTYSYRTNEYLPDDALGLWYWQVEVHCLGGHARSETRTFWVEEAPPALPVVPEPTTIVLMLVGAGGVGGYVALQWRARQQSPDE
jgi:hypothetical protein